MREHVGDAGGFEPVTLDVHQHLGVPCQRGGVARNIDDALWSAAVGQRFDDLDGAGTRRIDQQLVEVPQNNKFLGCHLEQVVDHEVGVEQHKKQNKHTSTNNKNQTTNKAKHNGPA